MPPETDDEREILLADAKTATLAGGGFGFGVLGILAIPILSVLGLLLSFFALRSARPQYRVGRIFAVIGLVISGLGLGMWITLTFLRGA